MSATVIDALMVTLGLDVSGYNHSMDEAEKKREDFAKRSRESTKAIKDGFAAVRNEVLLLAAAFTAGVGIKDFFASTINGAANLGYLSDNLSMTTERINAMQRASERFGGTQGGLTAQLKESVDTLAQLKLGMGPNDGLQWFFRQGGSSSDLKDGNSYLMARSKIIHDMFQVDPGKAALMARQMGISEDQFNFIKQGPAAIAAMTAEMEKNSVITKEDAEQAQKLRKNMLDLRDSLEKTATKIVFDLTPAIIELAKKFEGWAQWIAAHRGDIKEWVDAGVDSLRTFIGVADEVAQRLGGWQNVLIGLAAFKAASLVMELAKVAAAFITVGGAISGVAIAKAGLVGAAGAVGYGVGSLIYDNLGDSTKEKIGEFISRTLASFGNVQAGENIRINTGKDDYLTKGKGEAPKTSPQQERGIVQKLVGMGWTPEQAAGIAGSLKQESGLDPSAVNKQSGAYGMGQWLSKDRIANFEKVIGKPLRGSSEDDQLRFQQWELTNGPEKAAGDMLRAAKTAEEAAVIHRKFYERPGAAEANDEARMKYAAQFASASRSANAAASASVPAGPAAAVASRTDNSRSSTSTSETVINGGITINTPATDVKGIAKEIKPAIEKYNSTMQANTGIK